MRRAARATAAAAALAVFALAGCSSDDGVAGAADIGYVSGDGTVEEFAPGEREQAPDFGGTLVDGGSWQSSDHAGTVTVVNFWYAACAPCRIEAPVLAALQTEFGDDVAFIGVNLRDTAPTAAAFETSFDVPYPSILDEEDGAVQLAFAGSVVPNAVPTTLVIDAEGRIAARISGAIESESILSTLLREQL